MQAELIDYIKFGVLSPEQIKRLSVAKLTVPDTYNEDGYPIDGGLLDQRLGVIDPGLVCKTCGARAKICPGTSTSLNTSTSTSFASSLSSSLRCSTAKGKI